MFDDHDEAARAAVAVPRPEMVFEPVRDTYGPRLALVFGNHAPGGVCPYYAGDLCDHCDIGAGEGAKFDRAMNSRRLAWFAEYYQSHLPDVRHLVLYNSGSVLNPREMPLELLDEILVFARSLPDVSVVSLDSREAYIRPVRLRRVLSTMGDGIMIRPVLGIESSDDRIREETLRKAMPHTAIIRVFRDLSELAAEHGDDRVGLDVNILIGGPGTTPETAMDDAVETALFALKTGDAHGVQVDLNLHPYYIGARGIARFPDQRRCSSSTAAGAAREIAELVRSMGARTSIFVGWQDEGHDCERDARSLELERARAAFDRFNQTNEPRVLVESGLL